MMDRWEWIFTSSVLSVSNGSILPMICRPLVLNGPFFDFQQQKKDTNAR
jgi:hypothetical protein